jgi:glycosyltransferase involved in cell wall biosynthesis
VKILVAHNFYRSSSPSGENVVYLNECGLLERNGNEVVSYERFSDDIDDSTMSAKFRVALSCAWSHEIYNELSKLLAKVRPDVAHFHNTFPLMSPSAYAACRDNGVPVVQTLHNFRFICPGGLLLRDGRPCEDCVGTNLLPALQHRCYRGSLPATGALVWMLLRNRINGAYQTLVNRYVALTEFAASRLVAGGLPRERIVVKPNFVANIPTPGAGEGGYAVYVGRLSVEKGVRTMISAWKLLPGVPLKILGDGPLRQELERLAAIEKLPIEFLGFCDRATITDVVRCAAFQVVPSEWYEGFPMVIVEAYACGTPVVASRIGSLDEIVEEGVTGVKFEPGNPRDLSDKVNALWADRARQTMLRRTARESFEMKFSGEKNYEALRAIYEAAINDYAQTTRG